MPADAADHRLREDVSGHAEGGPENPAVASRIVLLAVGGFVLFAAAGMAGLAMYYRRAIPGPMNGPVRTFPAPHLQASPEADLARLLAEQKAALASYGWVDRPAGIARIPIEAAMAIVAGRGAAGLTAPDGPERDPVPGSRGGATAAPPAPTPSSGNPGRSQMDSAR